MKEVKEFLERINEDNNVFDDVSVSDKTLLYLLTNVGLYRLQDAITNKASDEEVKNIVIESANRLWGDLMGIQDDCVDDYKWHCELFIELYNERSDKKVELTYLQPIDEMLITFRDVDTNEEHQIHFDFDEVKKVSTSYHYTLLPHFEEV